MCCSWNETIFFAFEKKKRIVRSLFEFAEEVICHLKLVYVSCDDDTLENILHLHVLELVLQYYILIADLIDEELLFALRDLIVTVPTHKESRTIRNSGLPQIIIEKEKLLFLL